jgi:hypothetical protein
MFLLLDVWNNDSYVMRDMGLVGELALIDKAIALSTQAQNELQTSKRVLFVFFDVYGINKSVPSVSSV